MSDMPGIRTCVISGPNGNHYRIASGLTYSGGRIKCLCDVPGEVVPPNQCGVYFDGFYPEEFGEWEFMMETSIKNITTTAIIETVEGPCDVILPGVPGSKSSESSMSGESGEVSIDGQWGEWGPWSECSKSCGGGNMKSSRSCDSPPPSNGGATCPGRSSRVKQCNIQPCSIDGQWGEWGPWSHCSESCGGGNMNSSRSCDSPPPSSGGATCPGSSSRVKQCNIQPCSIDGQWGEWGP